MEAKVTVTKKEESPFKLVQDTVLGKPSSETRNLALLIYLGVFGIQAALGIVFPRLIAGFWGGRFSEYDGVTDLIRVVSILYGVFAYLCFVAKSVKDVRPLVLNASGILFATLAVWNLFVILFGHSLGVILLIHAPINAALGFVGLKQGGIMESVVKSNK